MKNRLIGYIILLLLSFTIESAFSQENKVEDMRSKAKAMRKEIEEKEKILVSSKKDINSRINNLKIISAKISEYEKLGKQLNKEIKALDNKIAGIDKRTKEISNEIEIKESDVERSREEYAEALRNARKYSNFENKLLFIFSADDFSTMARRYRYANNYMDAHKALADSLKKDIDELEEKKNELQSKKNELNRTKKSKEAVKKEQEAERLKIVKLKREQENIIASLKKERSKYEAELKKEKNELNKLNASIKLEIEKVVAAEAQKKAQAAAKANSKKESKTKVQDTSSYNKGAAAEKMSGSFWREECC